MRLRIKIGLLILIVISILSLLAFITVVIEVDNMQEAISKSGLSMTKKIGASVSSYAKNYGRMPNTSLWCNLLMKNSSTLHEYDFRVGQYNEVQCAIAYNRNLSDILVANLPGNIVVLFEADGPINLAGDANTMAKNRIKDANWEIFFSKDKFVYIYFFDKTIVKYRLRDGAVSKYDPEREQFLSYMKNSTYLPLQWQPTTQTATQDGKGTRREKRGHGSFCSMVSPPANHK
jgi:hypothetical protein